MSTAARKKMQHHQNRKAEESWHRSGDGANTNRGDETNRTAAAANTSIGICFISRDGDLDGVYIGLLPFFQRGALESDLVLGTVILLLVPMTNLSSIIVSTGSFWSEGKQIVKDGGG